MTSQSRCSRDDSFLATGTGLERRGEERERRSLGQLQTHRVCRLKASYHVQQVDGPFQGAAGSGARSVLAFLQHPPPVSCAVLIYLGSRRCCLETTTTLR